MKKGWRLLPPKHSRRDGGANQKDRSECRDIPGVGHPSLAAPDASQQRHGIGEREKPRGDLESWRQRGDWRMAVMRHRATVMVRMWCSTPRRSASVVPVQTLGCATLPGEDVTPGPSTSSSKMRRASSVCNVSQRVQGEELIVAAIGCSCCVEGNFSVCVMPLETDDRSQQVRFRECATFAWSLMRPIA